MPYLASQVSTDRIFTFSTPLVVLTAAFSQVVASVLRRTTWVKGAFNVLQWSLAAVYQQGSPSISVGPVCQAGLWDHGVSKAK